MHQHVLINSFVLLFTYSFTQQILCAHYMLDYERMYMKERVTDLVELKFWLRIRTKTKKANLKNGFKLLVRNYSQEQENGQCTLDKMAEKTSLGKCHLRRDKQLKSRHVRILWMKSFPSNEKNMCESPRHNITRHV